VREALQVHQPGEIDWVTFVGSGELLLHASTGPLIRGVKAMTELPVATRAKASGLFWAARIGARGIIVQRRCNQATKEAKMYQRAGPRFTLSRVPAAFAQKVHRNPGTG